MLGLLIAAVVLLSLGGEAVRLALRYERTAILNMGEYWRLISGHFVHGSIQHMAVNVAGLGLIAALFPRGYALSDWLVIGGLSLIAIDVGFVWYQPQLDWYVGLSGVLHGALAAGAIVWWRRESKALAAILAALLVGKLIWEQWQGALPLSGDIPVIVDAHLYGAGGGLVAGVLLWCSERRWPCRSRPL